MTTHPHPLVADYLARLRAHAARLPAAQGADLVADIEEHLAAALPTPSTANTPDDRRVVEVLDRLGDPADVVAAAGDSGGAGGAHAMPSVTSAPVPAPTATRPVAAVVLLVAAGLFGIVFPVAIVCWVVGLILFITSSSAWPRKVARVGGAVLVPYVLVTPALIVIEMVGFAIPSGTTCVSQSGSSPVCTSTSSWESWVAGGCAILLVAYILAGIVTAVLLAIRAVRATRLA